MTITVTQLFLIVFGSFSVGIGIATWIGNKAFFKLADTLDQHLEFLAKQVGDKNDND